MKRKIKQWFIPVVIMLSFTIFFLLAFLNTHSCPMLVFVLIIDAGIYFSWEGFLEQAEKDRREQETHDRWLAQRETD